MYNTSRSCENCKHYNAVIQDNFTDWGWCKQLKVCDTAKETGDILVLGTHESSVFFSKYFCCKHWSQEAKNGLHKTAKSEDNHSDPCKRDSETQMM